MGWFVPFFQGFIQKEDQNADLYIKWQSDASKPSKKFPLVSKF
jgi:hypothetical protein